MGYLAERGRELETLLAGHGIDGPARDEVVAFVKSLTLESYRNGQRAGVPVTADPEQTGGRGGKPPSAKSV